jgi:hypothetical protein
MSLLLTHRTLIVHCGADGLPLTVSWRGRRQGVVTILNRWRVESRWWDAPVERDYLKLLLEDGTLLLLAHDGTTGHWVVRRIYG